MSKEQEYRGLAARCLDLAAGATSLEYRLRLILMASAWLSLADKAASRLRQLVADHLSDQDMRPACGDSNLGQRQRHGEKAWRISLSFASKAQHAHLRAKAKDSSATNDMTWPRYTKWDAA